MTLQIERLDRSKLPPGYRIGGACGGVVWGHGLRNGKVYGSQEGATASAWDDFENENDPPGMPVEAVDGLDKAGARANAWRCYWRRVEIARRMEALADHCCVEQATYWPEVLGWSDERVKQAERYLADATKPPAPVGRPARAGALARISLNDLKIGDRVLVAGTICDTDPEDPIFPIEIRFMEGGKEWMRRECEVLGDPRGAPSASTDLLARVVEAIHANGLSPMEILGDALHEEVLQALGVEADPIPSGRERWSTKCAGDTGANTTVTVVEYFDGGISKDTEVKLEDLVDFLVDPIGCDEDEAAELAEELVEKGVITFEGDPPIAIKGRWSPPTDEDAG